MHETEIAKLLNIPFRELETLLEDSNRYHEFSIAKNRGGKRVIYAPNEQLKEIQQQLLHLFEANYTVHRQAHGFVKGKDFVTNAEVHIGKNYIFTFDIENFFPSIKRSVVINYFRTNLKMINHTSKTLADIVCHPAGFLPQGAPTSPMLSNLLLYQFDQNMDAIAKKYKCTYTRYADDITFSTNAAEFPRAIAKQTEDNQWQVNETINAELKSYGLRIHPEKVHMQKPNRKKVVTGVVVNEKLNVNRSYIKRIRAAIYNLQTKKYYKQEVCKVIGRSPDQAYFIDYEEVLKALRILRGQIEHIGNVRGKQDTYYLQLLKELRKLMAIYRYRKII